MNLRGLEIFAGVMDLGTLTDAAAARNLSQSAASRLLSLLEGEMGTPLFVREKRHLVPTEAGEALYPEALRILAQVAALPEVASGAKSSTALRVICHSRLAGQLVVPALTEFIHENPGQSIRLETAPRRELARRVLAGRYDFAVAALPLSIGALPVKTLGSVHLGIVLPATDPRSGAEVLTLGDVADLQYIALDETTAVRRAIDAVLETSDTNITPTHEVSTGTNAYRMVAAGLGFTFADPIALDPELTDRVKLVRWDKDVRMEIGVFRLGHGEAASHNAFENCLRAAIPTIQC